MGTIIIVVAIGWASQYSPGVMERTILNQQRYGNLPMSLPVVDGYVAVLDCNRLGEIVYLRPEGGEWEKFLVTDCARRDGKDGTRTWMLKSNIIVEVDYKTAVRWNTVGRGKRVVVGMPIKLKYMCE